MVLPLRCSSSLSTNCSVPFRLKTALCCCPCITAEPFGTPKITVTMATAGPILRSYGPSPGPVMQNQYCNEVFRFKLGPAGLVGDMWTTHSELGSWPTRPPSTSGHVPNPPRVEMNGEERKNQVAFPWKSLVWTNMDPENHWTGRRKASSKELLSGSM